MLDNSATFEGRVATHPAHAFGNSFHAKPTTVTQTNPTLPHPPQALSVRPGVWQLPRRDGLRAHHAGEGERGGRHRYDAAVPRRILVQRGAAGEGGKEGSLTYSLNHPPPYSPALLFSLTHPLPPSLTHSLSIPITQAVLLDVASIAPSLTV